jgi:hypothetical protein
MSTIDSEPSVFGLDSTILCRAAVRCQATSTVRPSRSTSCQRRPHSSPRRRPAKDAMSVELKGVIIGTGAAMAFTFVAAASAVPEVVSWPLAQAR